MFRHPTRLIGGEFPLILELSLKIAEIDGEIPPIYSKSMKMGGLHCITGKTSLISPGSELQSAINRKNSAYFPFAGSLMKGKQWALDENHKTIKPKVPDTTLPIVPEKNIPIVFFFFCKRLQERP
ncbi:hypothetical protein COJ96_27505 [Bacillus sp. AFS073361]|nr:hypothetical protein COJ96_27505 [Bacillus sp. AFS073361]